MTVCMVISLQKKTYVHRIYLWMYVSGQPCIYASRGVWAEAWEKPVALPSSTKPFHLRGGIHDKHETNVWRKKMVSMVPMVPMVSMVATPSLVKDFLKGKHPWEARNKYDEEKRSQRVTHLLPLNQSLQEQGVCSVMSAIFVAVQTLQDNVHKWFFNGCVQCLVWIFVAVQTLQDKVHTYLINWLLSITNVFEVLINAMKEFYNVISLWYLYPSVCMLAIYSLTHPPLRHRSCLRVPHCLLLSCCCWPP